MSSARCIPLRRRPPRRASLLSALLLSAVALAACGESDQEKATAQVCAARADISKQIGDLQSLTPSTNLVSDVKGHVETIGKDLTKIKDAQPKLEPKRREQVQSATKAFETELTAVSSRLTAGLQSGSLEARLKTAGSQVESALRQLAGAYKQALGPISCS